MIFLDVGWRVRILCRRFDGGLSSRRVGRWIDRLLMMVVVLKICCCCCWCCCWCLTRSIREIAKHRQRDSNRKRNHFCPIDFVEDDRVFVDDAKMMICIFAER